MDASRADVELPGPAAASAPPARLAVVDLADFESRKGEVAAQLLGACEDHGFFYLMNHGLDAAAVEAAFARSRSFFALDAAAKRAVRGDSSNAHYLLGYTEEVTAGVVTREGLLCGFDTSRSVWPAAALGPGFKAETLAFMADLHAVAERVLRAAALALGWAEDAVVKLLDLASDDCGTALFCNRYPSLEGAPPLPPGSMRIWPHTDFEASG